MALPSSLNAPFGAQCFPTRPYHLQLFLNRSQCTFWCSVLSDSSAGHGRRGAEGVSMHLLVLSAFRPVAGIFYAVVTSGSQCTFWCSVLSDWKTFTWPFVEAGLNAPFGAQCFPTRFGGGRDASGGKSQCTFWCSVLSDPCLPPRRSRRTRPRSQCTFWCSVLSDLDSFGMVFAVKKVSMHLLVLSAFRPHVGDPVRVGAESQCTFWCSVLSDRSRALPSPRRSRSQCTFWCSVLSDCTANTGTPTRTQSQCTFWCSVLSDLLPKEWEQVADMQSQCTFWCSVLSDKPLDETDEEILESQCTFWCSVLSDTIPAMTTTW